MHKQTFFDHLILIAGAVAMCGPLLAMFLVTTHEGGFFREHGLTLVPGDQLLNNYGRFLGAEAGFTGDVTALGMVWNSFVLGAGFAAIKVVLSLLAAYALTYFRPRFAELIFWLLLLSLMLPLESRFLPTYAVVADLGLVNTRAGLILPLVASGIGTFFFRQFLRNVPDTLLESARLDGAGPLRFFVDILAPLSWPMAGALFLVTFVNGWNQYLWPVMVTSDEAAYTLVRGLQFYGRTSLNGMMLACLAVLPPLLLLVVFQRQFVKGLFDGSH
ncbi:ABC transporter permease subunit [Roseibium sp.]|uniref:ABC transporter permease subunit n=1 Tax=Roseibium sp. TaxID=1936156 RepID=UPI003A97F553